jgi:hypothetical protein
MTDYIVLFREAGDEHPANPPLMFHCQADAGDHAEEQCLDAYSGCTVAWVYAGNSWQQAFDDYYGEEQ